MSRLLTLTVVGVESSMADTDNRQQRVEQFYRAHKTEILASARRLDQECPEDVVQAVLEIWLRPTYDPQFSFKAFVRQMELLVFRDGHYRSKGTKQVYLQRPREDHGDIDLMWRRRHGRRTSREGGAE